MHFLLPQWRQGKLDKVGKGGQCTVLLPGQGVQTILVTVTVSIDALRAAADATALEALALEGGGGASGRNDAALAIDAALLAGAQVLSLRFCPPSTHPARAKYKADTPLFPGTNRTRLSPPPRTNRTRVVGLRGKLVAHEIAARDTEKTSSPPPTRRDTLRYKVDTSRPSPPY